MTGPSSAAAPAIERPLGDAARLVLIASAALVIVAFYLYALGSILLLLVFLLCEVAVCVVALRVGLSRLLMPGIQRRSALLVIFFRSLWIRERPKARVYLEEPDAPRLFAFLARLSQDLRVRPPRKVVVEMSSGAWVELRGLRRGADKTTLGLGYDLLAGLTETELEAVLAHEMVHAKSVRRGLRRWLIGGMSRAATLTNELAGRVGAYRRAKKAFTTGEGLLFGADRSTRLAARLIATYSRQDEFEADLGAARACGSGPLRSSLIKLEQMAPITARIPWNERVAQLQRGNGFSSWLVAELAVRDLHQESVAEGGVPNLYSTHPSLRDRLAALPPDTAPPRESPPAVGLLANPDAVAARLAAEIQRLAAGAEARDSAERRRWLARTQRSGKSGPFQYLGLLVILLGIVAVPFSFVYHFSVIPMLVGAAMIAGGAWLMRQGRYRDRRVLPTPGFSSVKAAAERPDDVEARKVRENELEAKLRAGAAAHAKKLPKKEYLLGECYGALERCDYLHAHVAARVCLEAEKANVEARLALAVAWASFRNAQHYNNVTRAVHKATGFRSRSTLWGAGWALTMLGDWAAAEAFIVEAMRRDPGDTRLPAFAALCQMRRNKFHCGIVNAKTALAAAPGDAELIKLLAGLLISAGFLAEAQAVLATSQIEAHLDPELDLLAIRLLLIQGNTEAADQAARQLLGKDAAAHFSIRLGEAFENARCDGKAYLHYQTASARGHFPEAHLGLARIHARLDDREAARRELCTALCAAKPVGEKGAGLAQVFPVALRQLLLLEAPTTEARAWTATFPGNAAAGALSSQTFLVFAADQKAAEGFMSALSQAVLAGKEAQPPVLLKWELAAKDRQPVGAVRPGVQAFWTQ
jgi:Zn-dependent protease with chaperone function/tetratricopeptide (TPR) repeat protein